MRRDLIALVGLAALAAVCLILMQVWTKPEITAGANGLPMLDLRADGYGFDAVQAYLAELSEPARRLYLGPQRILDTLFPIGLAGALALGIYLGLRRNFGRWALAGALVPSAYFYADMLENSAVAGLLRSGMILPTDVELASAYTVLKFQLFYSSVLLLLLCLIGQGVRWSLNRFRETQ